MTATDWVTIIGAVGIALVSIITALKVRSIEHSVNSAATQQVSKVDALTAQVAALTKSLADEKMVAERLAQFAGTPRRSTQKRKPR